MVGIDSIHQCSTDARGLFTRTYPLLLVGNLLFDLMITSCFTQFSGRELAEHVEEQIIQNLTTPEWHPEQIPEFQGEEMCEVLYEIYTNLGTQVWPVIHDDHHMRTTTSMSNINLYAVEVNIYRPRQDLYYGT